MAWSASARESASDRRAELGRAMEALRAGTATLHEYDTAQSFEVIDNESDQVLFVGRTVGYDATDRPSGTPSILARVRNASKGLSPSAQKLPAAGTVKPAGGGWYVVFTDGEGNSQKVQGMSAVDALLGTVDA
jgi:hypothetical protein